MECMILPMGWTDDKKESAPGLGADDSAPVTGGGDRVMEGARRLRSVEKRARRKRVGSIGVLRLLVAQDDRSTNFAIALRSTLHLRCYVRK